MRPSEASPLILSDGTLLITNESPSVEKAGSDSPSLADDALHLLELPISQPLRVKDVPRKTKTAPA
jgi:hypothetical protein